MIIFGVLYLNDYLPFFTMVKGGIISDIFRSLGPLPEQSKGLYTHPEGLDSWYDQGKAPEPNHDLASKIAYFRPDADSVERELVHSIMLKVFTYYPEKCLTVTLLLRILYLEHSWKNMVFDVILVSSALRCYFFSFSLFFPPGGIAISMS